MKKLFFALACVIGLMTFASCTPEAIDDLLAQKPTVEFVSEAGFTSISTSFYVGDTIYFKVKVAPNSGSQSELDHFDFSITTKEGATVVNENPEIIDPAGDNFFTFSFAPEAADNYTVTATITDKAKKANVAAIIIDYVQPIVEGIGTFEGTVNINGHITSNAIQNIPPYDEDYDITDLPLHLVLGTNVEGKINATMEIDGNPVTLYATQDGENLVFDQFHFYKEIELMPQNVTLDLTMNMTGVLHEDTLTLSGDCTGNGSTTIILAVFNVDMTGVIEGTLNKVVAE